MPSTLRTGGAAFTTFALLAICDVTRAAEAPIRLTPGAAPPSPEVIAMLAAKDREVFEAAFGCQLDRLAPLVADDFEFLHDKWGMTAASGATFLASVTKGCTQQEKGTDFKARRELVEGTMTVFLLNHYGAMQTGTHRFFALQPGKPDKLTEVGKFVHIWKQEGDSWKLSRVISYDHQLAE